MYNFTKHLKLLTACKDCCNTHIHVYNRVKQNDEVSREQRVNYESKLDNIQHYAFMSKAMGIKVEERYRSEESELKNEYNQTCI